MVTRHRHVGSILTAWVLTFGAAGPVDAQSASVIGSWEGELGPPGGPTLTVVYHVEAAADGSLTGTLDSPDQNASGIPLSTVSFSNGVLTVVAAAVPGEPTFVGTLSDDGSTLSGTFVQGDGSLALELMRREDPT